MLGQSQQYAGLVQQVHVMPRAYLWPKEVNNDTIWSDDALELDGMFSLVPVVIGSLVSYRPVAH